MFLKFHEAKERREGGFTLIELLVVILIIAILAAIAIPVFLRQREKGWRSQVQSALKNAATAEESWLTANNSYTMNVADLQAEGFKKAAAVTVTPVTANGTEYCLNGSHSSLQSNAVIFHYSSADGEPLAGSCAVPAP